MFPNPHGFMWYPEVSLTYSFPLPTQQQLSTEVPISPDCLLPTGPKEEEFDETIPLDPANENSPAMAPVQGPDWSMPQRFPFYPPYLMPQYPSTPANSPAWCPPPYFHGFSQNSNSMPSGIGLISESEQKKNKQKTPQPRRFPDYVKAAFLARYKENKFISGKPRELFAQQLGLSVDQVKVWFQNQRYKDRKLGKVVNEEEKPLPDQKSFSYPAYPYSLQ